MLLEIREPSKKQLTFCQSCCYSQGIFSSEPQSKSNMGKYFSASWLNFNGVCIQKTFS